MLERIATALVLAVLLAPPGWCCTFTPCPLGRCARCEPTSKEPTAERPVCRRCGGDKAESCGMADGAAAAQGTPAPQPSPDECPCRQTMGAVVAKTTVPDQAAAALFVGVGVSAGETHAADRLFVAPPLRPGVDLQTLFCRLRC